jgi:hypothetical protein
LKTLLHPSLLVDCIICVRGLQSLGHHALLLLIGEALIFLLASPHCSPHIVGMMITLTSTSLVKSTRMNSIVLRMHSGLLPNQVFWTRP